MAYNLDKLPSELIAQILWYLPLNDHKSMRLVNHVLEVKTTQKAFKDLFIRKRLDITKENLEAFVAVTEPGRLGNLLTDLTLVGVSINHTELSNTVRKGTRSRSHFSGSISVTSEHPMSPAEKNKASNDLRELSQLHSSILKLFGLQQAEVLLSTAFKNLKTNGLLKGLESLSMAVIGLRNDPAKRLQPSEYKDYADIWSTAGLTFHASMMAVANSGLPINEMQIFNSIKCCSLSRRRLNQFGSVTLKQITAQLTKLDISLSNEFRSCETQRTDTARIVLDDDFSGLSELLSSCSYLKELRIHYFCMNKLGQRSDPTFIANTALFSSKHDWSVGSPLALKVLELSGVKITEINFLTFLRYHSCEALHIDNMELQQGSFRPIFDWITGPQSSLATTLRIEDVYEKKLLYFPDLVLPFRNIARPTILYREGDEIRKPITYVLSNQSRSISLPGWSYHERFGPLP